MANLDKFKDNPQEQLLEELKGARCVMLGTPHQHDKHMQPMSPQIDVENEAIYFYSDNTSELGQAVKAAGGKTHMCHIEDDYQACVSGILSVHNDPETVDKFWNPIVAAWYPQGKDDPKLMMLKFIPIDAAIWASDKSTLGFVYEMAKANLKKEMPNMGEMKVVNL